MMFPKKESALSSAVVVPVVVLFGLVVSGFVAILLFAGSRHIAAGLPVPKPDALASADVAANYTAALQVLRTSIAASKESDGDMVRRVTDVLFSVRVPATGLTRHLHAVIAVQKLNSIAATRTAKDTQANLVGILDALTHS